MFISQQSTFTSEAFIKHGDNRAWVFGSGTGTFRIERLDESGAWKQYPELTFSAPCAKVVELPPGKLRVVVTAGPIDVEVKVR